LGYNLPKIKTNTMIDFIKNMFSSAPVVDFASLVKAGAIILDVRTPGEFNSGHIKGSINIPLDEIKNKTAELKKKSKVIITCCRSGNRSGMAAAMLTTAGIECHNGGPWNVLNNKI
jgi:phage shock protein E